MTRHVAVALSMEGDCSCCDAAYLSNVHIPVRAHWNGLSQKLIPREHVVIALTGSGTGRVLDGRKGQTFVVDCFTYAQATSGPSRFVAHVRDYSYMLQNKLGKEYQIWSLGPEDYVLLDWNEADRGEV